MNVRRLTGTIGAEIRGVDLRDGISEELAADLRRWLDVHKVIFLPDAQIDDLRHCEIGRVWGDLEVHSLIPHVDGHPEVIELSSEVGVADTWHTDLTFKDEPTKVSVLRTVVTPEMGGDTMWSDQVAAFEALSAPLQDLLCGLTADHAATSFGRLDLAAEHPIVRTDRETGERSLFVNRLFTTRIVQLAEPESDALLAFLFAHCEHPRFTVRYAWQQGTVAVWDNRRTQHFVVDDFTGLRVIRRVTVAGDRIEGPVGGYRALRPADRAGSASAD